MRIALWPECPPERHALEISMATNAADDAGVLVLDRGNGKLGGFVELTVQRGVDGAHSEEVGFLEGWYVDEDLRGQGLGRSLIEAAERWTLARGLTELASDAEIENEHAIAAHKAAGFRETFRVVQFLKELESRSPLP